MVVLCRHATWAATLPLSNLIVVFKRADVRFAVAFASATMVRSEIVVIAAITVLVVVLSIAWVRGRHNSNGTSARWCALMALHDVCRGDDDPGTDATTGTVDEEVIHSPSAQLARVSPAQAVRGEAFEAKRAAEMARFQRLHADRAAIAPLKVHVWNVVFGGYPFTAELSNALHALSPRQFRMLRLWLLRNLPRRRTLLELDDKEHDAPWTEVGSVRSHSDDLSNIHVAPLHVQRHKSEPRRFNYRLRFRDRNGGEAWVQLGDDNAQRDGLRWIHHGSEVQVLDHMWTVFLAPDWRNRSL